MHVRYLVLRCQSDIGTYRGRTWWPTGVSIKDGNTKRGMTLPCTVTLVPGPLNGSKEQSATDQSE